MDIKEYIKMNGLISVNHLASLKELKRINTDYYNKYNDTIEVIEGIFYATRQQKTYIIKNIINSHLT